MTRRRRELVLAVLGDVDRHELAVRGMLLADREVRFDQGAEHCIILDRHAPARCFEFRAGDVERESLHVRSAVQIFLAATRNRERDEDRRGYGLGPHVNDSIDWYAHER